MSTEQLREEAMSLPISERVSLAQALWESINPGLVDTDEQAAVREAARRHVELSSGALAGAPTNRLCKQRVAPSDATDLPP